MKYVQDKTNKIFIGGLKEDGTHKEIRDMIMGKLGYPPKSISLMLRN